MRIALGERPTATERRAAEELRRYLYHLTGEVAGIGGAPATFQLGTVASNATLAGLAEDGSLAAPEVPESYVLRTVGSVIAVLGADPMGVRAPARGTRHRRPRRSRCAGSGYRCGARAPTWNDCTFFPCATRVSWSCAVLA